MVAKTVAVDPHLSDGSVVVVSEDISGCKQEKEERQAEENRLRMKQEEREDATLSRETQGQQEALAENKGE